MRKFIELDDLMDLAAIDGDYNKPRVEAWQNAAEAEIRSFTSFDINATRLCDADLTEFIAVARVYIQERVRENFLSPNYQNDRGIMALKIRLSLLADELLERELLLPLPITQVFRASNDKRFQTSVGQGFLVRR